MPLRTHLNVKLKSELENYVINDNQIVLVPGVSAVNDTPFQYYYYDTNSSATPDGDNVIQPLAVVEDGRYLKMPNTQTKADWNASSGLGQILNKPTIPTAVSGLTNDSGYITQSGARSAISVANTGTSGNASYNSSTGVINIPNYTYTPTALSFNNAPARTLVTSSTATGFQVSATRNANVRYSVTINTTVSLSGNATGYVALEICPTNSTTAGDWIEVGRVSSGQSGTIVVGLTLNQVGGGQIGCIVPAGYYTRIRSVNTAGNPTYSVNGSQEVLM